MHKYIKIYSSIGKFGLLLVWHYYNNATIYIYTLLWVFGTYTYIHTLFWVLKQLLLSHPHPLGVYHFLALWFNIQLLRPVTLCLQGLSVHQSPLCLQPECWGIINLGQVIMGWFLDNKTLKCLFYPSAPQYKASAATIVNVSMMLYWLQPYSSTFIGGHLLNKLFGPASGEPKV